MKLLKQRKKKWLFLVPVRSVSVKGSSSITPLFMRYGQSKQAGYEAVIINNNPETVSTDFNTSDRLYFEPLFFEDVMNVIEQEKPIGVIVQFGGQTAINLAAPLDTKPVYAFLVQILESIDDSRRSQEIRSVASQDLISPTARQHGYDLLMQAVGTAASSGYPVLVRPSYVLGGRAMEIVYSDEELLSLYGIML